MMPLELMRHFRLFYLFFIMTKTTISLPELRRLFFVSSFGHNKCTNSRQTGTLQLVALAILSKQHFLLSIDFVNATIWIICITYFLLPVKIKQSEEDALTKLQYMILQDTAFSNKCFWLDIDLLSSSF